MAFPTVVAVTASQQTSNSTTSTVTFAAASAGELILAFVAADSNAASFTWPAPWVELVDDAGTGFVGTVGYLIASGGETSVGVTHTTERSNHLAVRISGWHGTTPPEITAKVSGSSNAPDPGSLTPSWGADDTLWVAAAMWDDSAAPTVSTYPTNYSSNNNTNATASSAARLALGTRELNATSDDPGAFGLSGSETWNAYTIAVRPAAAAGGVTATPGVASLALTTFAPVVTASANKVATPATASLTLTGFAPTVGIGVNVVPATAALTLATFAPTISVSDNKLATPGVASLSLTAFAPTVTASDHKTATPGVAALTLTTFAPTVTASSGQVATPGTAALTITAFAPTVTATANQTVTPGVLALVITTYAPTVTASAPTVSGTATASVLELSTATATVGGPTATATVANDHTATPSVT